MVLRKFLKTIQSEESPFQVPRSFQTEVWSKTGEKHKNLHIQNCPGHDSPLAGHVYALGSDVTALGMANPPWGHG